MNPEILIKASQLITCLSILVILHELGHFIPARLFKTRVEKFFLFFDISRIKLFSFKRGDTEYGVGWLPLGGYVKIAGMIDESLDVKNLKEIPEPWEYRAKPAWQRLIIISGGVIMNLILGIIIFTGIYLYWGEQYLLNKNVKYGIESLEIGKQIGLQSGDKILKVNGKELERFEDALRIPLLHSKNSYTIQRGDSIFELPVPENLGDLLVENTEKGLFTFAFNFKVGQLLPGSNAEKAGLLVDDEITGINGKNIFLFHEFREELLMNKNSEINLEIKRKGSKQQLTVLVDTAGKIGFAPMPLMELSTTKFGPFEAIGLGTQKAFGVIGDQYNGLKKIFRGETKAKNSLGSFIRIGSVFDANWDWRRFWNLTAMLSMVLAVMNVLPIPALDGGHILFLLPEFVTGKRPSDKFLEKAQWVGMVILGTLMLYALFNDLVWAFLS